MEEKEEEELPAYPEITILLSTRRNCMETVRNLKDIGSQLIYLLDAKDINFRF